MKIEVFQSPPTLEDAYGPNLEQLSSQAQILALRNFCRWKIVDMVLLNYELVELREFVDWRHNESGRSIRDITADLNELMRSFISNPDSQNALKEIIQAVKSEVQALLEDISFDYHEVVEKSESALAGSARKKMQFDLLHFVSNISKNALSKLFKVLEIPCRDYAHKWKGAGFHAKRKMLSQKTLDDATKARISESAQISWENNQPRRVEASYRAAYQMKDQEQQAKMQRGRLPR